MLTESAEQAGTSIWRRSLPPVEQESLGSERIEEVDLAVIGGGFTGLSAAYHALATHPGMRVVLLEGERIGHGASSRNTGMLTPGVGQHLAALVKRFGAGAAQAMYERSLEAVEYVGELSEREQIDARLRMTGQLVVAHGRSGRRRLARQADLMKSLDLPCERLDDNGLRAAPPPGNHRAGERGGGAGGVASAGGGNPRPGPPGRGPQRGGAAARRADHRGGQGESRSHVGRRFGSASPTVASWWPTMWSLPRVATQGPSTFSPGRSSPSICGCC